METPHKKGITKENMQFIVWIITLVVAVVLPLMTYKSAIELNTFQIKEMGLDRKESWGGQLTINDRLNMQIAEMDKTLASLKTRVDYIEK